MPYKDPNDPRRKRSIKKANDKHYENHREEVITAVAKRKLDEYGSNCVVCGKRMMNESKNAPKRRFCQNHRKELWEEKLERVFTKATRDDPKSSRQYAVKIQQDQQVAANRVSPSFSRLKHSEGRVRVWMNENQPVDNEGVDS